MKLVFSAKVNIIGVNPYVYLPKYILAEIFIQAKKDTGPIPVKGTINEKPFIQTLIKYKGFWRLYLNGIMRKATNSTVGDTVTIHIMYDASSREVPIHSQFSQALKKNKKALQVFDSYAPSRQKEINRYLNNIKTKETLTKNIDRIVRHLSGEDVGYFVLLRNKK